MFKLCTYGSPTLWLFAAEGEPTDSKSTLSISSYKYDILNFKTLSSTLLGVLGPPLLFPTAKALLKLCGRISVFLPSYLNPIPLPLLLYLSTAQKLFLFQQNSDCLSGVNQRFTTNSRRKTHTEWCTNKNTRRSRHSAQPFISHWQNKSPPALLVWQFNHLYNSPADLHIVAVARKPCISKTIMKRTK